MLYIVAIWFSSLYLSRQNVCTDVNGFPQLNNNYTVVGLLRESTPVWGILGCVQECQMMATYDAFTNRKNKRDCSVNAQFELSSPNNVDDNDALTSVINDWNNVQNYTKDRVMVTRASLTPGQDCYIPGTEQLLLNGTVVKTRAFYNGTSNVTLSGRECQMWAAHTPLKHYTRGVSPGHFGTGETMDKVANHCRIVLPDLVDTPWCYTTDLTKRSELCNITKCT